jgi:sec-independent protein translocase protein TatA
MNQPLFFLPLGGQEMLLIVLVIFLLFGATRLPQLAKALGQSKKAFREGIEEGEREEPVKKVEKSA